jgi:hypothetical protein
MAECQAAWYLRRKLGLEVTSRPIGKAASELALLVALPGGDVSVEVKSPFRDALADGVARTVHDSDILGQRVADASRQLDEKPCNLVMLVGRMTLGVEVRRFFIKAFYAAEVMVFDHATGRARTEFRDPGLFLKVWPGEDGPRHRRVGGVLYVEENIRSHESPAGALGMRAEHDALMMHNPMAHQPLPEAPWGDCPQFVPRGERMEWTDGQPAGGPYGLS